MHLLSGCQILTALRVSNYHFIFVFYNNKCIAELAYYLLNSLHTISGSIHIKLHSQQSENNKTITLMMIMVTSSWSQTWKKCIIDTIKYQPSIEWNEILNSIIWGRLIYPL